MKTRTITAFLGRHVAVGLGLALLGSTGWSTAQVTVTSVLTNGLAEPYGLAVDEANNLYFSDSVHNCIRRLDNATGGVTLLAGLPGDGDFLGNDGYPWEAHFFSPQGVALGRLGGVDGLFVADTGNHTIRFVRLSDGYVSTIAGEAGSLGNADGPPGVSRLNNPSSLALDAAGRLYIADTGNNAIRVLDTASLSLTTLGADTAFNRPAAVAFGRSNELWVADTRNHVVKLLRLTSPTAGTLVSTLGSVGNPGYQDAPAATAARFNGPRGLLWWDSQSALIIADTANHAIRIATNNPTYGPNNWSVQFLAGRPGQNGFADGPAATAKFDTPVCLAMDREIEGFLVADLKNNAIRRIQAGPALPPVAAPRIGWVDFVWNEALGTDVTLLRTDDQPRIFNNEVYFAILYERGTECHYTTANTPWPAGFTDYGETPSKTVGATPPEYVDGIPRAIFMETLPVLSVERSATLGGVVIKAIGYAAGRPNSPVVKANYAFKAATPTIAGNNLASFKVSTATVNPPATVRFTVDGSDPTATSEAVPLGGQVQLSLPEGQTNVVFRVRAFAPQYLPSDISEKVFSVTNFLPTRIALGFANGEASSRFVASPGQTFYVPVTLQLAEDATMYSLQFNCTITNLAGPPVASGLDFVSMLYEQVAAEKGEKAPAGQGNWYRVIPPAMWSANPPADRLIIRASDPTIPLMDLTFFDSGLGLIGVGWIERWLFKDLYDTTKQDLIQYSIARDTLFDKSQNRVLLGAAALEVPATAPASARYQITLGRPSATSDGVGAPGSQVYIAVPISGHLTNDGCLGQRTITMGQARYTVGDIAPFGWFNAGEFGDGYLLNDDVVQVFESAIYNFSPVNPRTGAPSDPPYHSDLRDAMDAGPVLGGWDGTAGCYTNTGVGTPALPLYDGNDLTINDVAFGDGVLDVTDVYITFRRSLDPSLRWYARFWTNGTRVAVQVPNRFPSQQMPAPIGAASGPPEPAGDPAAADLPPGARFTVGDARVAAGQTVQLPVRARIQGRYPVRVLMFSLRVQPLEGAPALAEPIRFMPDAALGQPTMGGQAAANRYAAAWLNPDIPGLTGEVAIGTLTVRLPTNAPSGAAYVVCFDHVSASPNGLAVLPLETQPGLVTLADRSGCSRSDGIPDAWRLRYFGAVNAILAAATADADGDGHSNLAEFRAGTNPNDAASVLRLRQPGRPGGGAPFLLRWPSGEGKHYVIECAGQFGGPWTPLATVTGTGCEMEFRDEAPAGTPRFYRIRLAD